MKTISFKVSHTKDATTNLKLLKPQAVLKFNLKFKKNKVFY